MKYTPLSLVLLLSVAPTFTMEKGKALVPAAPTSAQPIGALENSMYLGTLFEESKKEEQELKQKVSAIETKKAQLVAALQIRLKGAQEMKATCENRALDLTRALTALKTKHLHEQTELEQKHVLAKQELEQKHTAALHQLKTTATLEEQKLKLEQDKTEAQLKIEENKIKELSAKLENPQEVSLFWKLFGY